jgi:hypothetical protein
MSSAYPEAVILFWRGIGFWKLGALGVLLVLIWVLAGLLLERPRQKLPPSSNSC